MKQKKIILGLSFMFFSFLLNSVEITPLQKLTAEKVIKPFTENNPTIAHKFNADPAVLVYKDTVYLYCTNDAQQAEFSLGKQENSYNKINTLNIFSSKDLVNWTDCGEIAVAGKQNPKGAAKWAANSWAPAICTKKINGTDKFFLYFADSANGIGVLTSDSPLGPFSDPLGKALINRKTPNTQKVYWLFDPAVFVDDDETGYLYFGGGIDKDSEHPKSARVVKLNPDMISINGEPVEIDAPFLFEDSSINKIGNTYYYSYCANWASRENTIEKNVPPAAYIAYMTSSSPMGPFKYAGYTLKNPGNYFNVWGNNHHWIFEFKGKYYIAFHAQLTEKNLGFQKTGYRNICISEFRINDDGTFPIQTVTKTGVKQTNNFNPYENIKAATFANFKNIAVTSKQTITGICGGSYVCIKNVDLSKGGKEFILTTGEENKKSTIKIYKNSISEQNLLSQIKTKGKGTFKGKIENLEKSICNLFIVIDEKTELESWKINF